MSGLEIRILEALEQRVQEHEGDYQALQRTSNLDERWAAFTEDAPAVAPPLFGVHKAPDPQQEEMEQQVALRRAALKQRAPARFAGLPSATRGRQPGCGHVHHTVLPKHQKDH